jgi:ATP-dependent DNA helicase RecG
LTLLPTARIQALNSSVTIFGRNNSPGKSPPLPNLKGGRILLGVEDSGAVSGITRRDLSEWVADGENVRREKIWFYPYEALRELLINALAHRDWSRFVDVEIAGYRDRLEIISPGSLPNAMTVEKMLAGQRSARNHIVVEVLRDYGYVDARGMGVRTKVVPVLKAAGTEPGFEVTDDYLKTTIKQVKGQKKRRYDPINDLLKEYDDLINAIINSPQSDYHQFAETMGVSSSTIKRHIQKLKQAGFLRRVGSKKKGQWEVLGR